MAGPGRKADECNRKLEYDSLLRQLFQQYTMLEGKPVSLARHSCCSDAAVLATSRVCHCRVWYEFVWHIVWHQSSDGRRNFATCARHSRLAEPPINPANRVLGCSGARVLNNLACLLMSIVFLRRHYLRFATATMMQNTRSHAFGGRVFLALILSYILD
jgi:hypothetical protein